MLSTPTCFCRQLYTTFFRRVKCSTATNVGRRTTGLKASPNLSVHVKSATGFEIVTMFPQAVSPNPNGVGAMVKTTRAQREAIFRVFQRDFPSYITPFKRETVQRCSSCGQPLQNVDGPTVVRVPSINYRRFRAQVRPFFGDTCVMIPWKGMWLGIETDGYTHS